MYGLTNSTTLSDELKSELHNIDWEITTLRHKIEAAEARKAALQVRIDALAPQVIEVIDWANDDRQRIHRALNLVRKSVGKGISLDRHVTYNGDVLETPAYVSYPMDEGVGEKIAFALRAEGLAVEWDGNYGRAITVLPSFIGVEYYKSWWTADGERSDEGVLTARAARTGKRGW